MSGIDPANLRQLQMGVSGKLDRGGQFRPIQLVIQPLDQRSPRHGETFTFTIDNFFSYSFKSSMITPIDTFTFSFAEPDGPAFIDFVKEGDVAIIKTENYSISMGIIDTIEIMVDGENGERVTVQGRNLLGQLEDQSAISIDSVPFYGKEVSIEEVVRQLTVDTRINKFEMRGINRSFSPIVFATEPGESKLTAFQRYIDARGLLVWSDGDGTMLVGKPDFSQASKGTLICSKEKRFSNVLDIKASFAASQIPNIVVALWTGQEKAVGSVQKYQKFNNNAEGPKRLLDGGHRVVRSFVSSDPKGDDPEDFKKIAEGQFGKDRMSLYARREIAKENFKELLVQCRVPGHFNENGEPFTADSMYHIEFDRASIDSPMYLYDAEYTLTEQGQFTNLSFCKTGTIVPDCRFPGYSFRRIE